MAIVPPTPTSAATPSAPFPPHAATAANPARNNNNNTTTTTSTTAATRPTKPTTPAAAKPPTTAVKDPLSPPRSPSSKVVRIVPGGRSSPDSSTTSSSSAASAKLPPSPPLSKTHSRAVSSAGKPLSRSGTCEDALDDEDPVGWRRKASTMAGSQNGASAGEPEGTQRQIADGRGGSAGEILDGLLEELVRGPSPRASTPEQKTTPQSSRAASLSPSTTVQSSPNNRTNGAESSNNINNNNNNSNGEYGSGSRTTAASSIFSSSPPPHHHHHHNSQHADFPWLSPKSPVHQELADGNYLSFPAGFTTGNSTSGSPTPSLSGSKFTPLKRVKKTMGGSINGSPGPYPRPETSSSVHSHSKRPSTTSGTTEVASAGAGGAEMSTDAADYGINGTKLATVFQNTGKPVPAPAGGSGSTNGAEAENAAPADLVLLHISLIIPPNSSPAYVRHQRRMLRRGQQHKRLGGNAGETESTSSFADSRGDSFTDVNGADEGDQIDDDDDDEDEHDDDEEALEPGPLSALSPVVYQRGILIPHPRGDYALLQREVGKVLGLPFQDEDTWSEEDEADENAGVRGKGWQMRVYARNGWLTKGAWERAWAEMERVDVEVLEVGPRRPKSSGKGVKTGRVRRSGKRSRQQARAAGGRGKRAEAGAQDNAYGGGYYDPGDESLDEGIPSVGAYLSDYDDRAGPALSHADLDDSIDIRNASDISDDEPAGAADTHPAAAGPPKAAPLQLENGTVGDGELEEAFRAYGENAEGDDEAAIDEHDEDFQDYVAVDADGEQAPNADSTTAPRGHSTASRRSGSHRRTGSGVKPAAADRAPSRAKSPFASAIVGKPDGVHPYQYLLDLLKPIVLTGIVVTGAMFFLGPISSKKGSGSGIGSGRYGSWGSSDRKGYSNNYVDNDSMDMDQDIEDRCAGYAREAEMWRNWKEKENNALHYKKDDNSHSKKQGGKSGGDWTVTVTQTVTQRIVNAGATQIVVEIPSGEAQFPLGPLGLSNSGTLQEVLGFAATTAADELPLETGKDGPKPTATPGGDKLVAEDAKDKLAGEEKQDEKAAEAAAEDEVVYVDATEPEGKGGAWWGKIGKII
ncbi:hypothetical protein DFH27DRAFT_527970 [Peziza echinospora]|nr:hypothetical protein DFH27DRAFT_527970 [Peziza echinospora]